MLFGEMIVGVAIQAARVLLMPMRVFVAVPALADRNTFRPSLGVLHEPDKELAAAVGIPEEVEHGIRRKWNSDSGGSGTANPGSGTRNPEEVEHRFRRKWNSGSGGRERSSVA